MECERDQTYLYGMPGRRRGSARDLGLTGFGQFGGLA